MNEFTKLITNKRKASDFFCDDYDNKKLASTGSSVLFTQAKSVSNINILKKVVQDQLSAAIAADKNATPQENNKLTFGKRNSDWFCSDDNGTKALLLEEKYSSIGSCSLRYKQEVISAINDEQQVSVEGVYTRNTTNCEGGLLKDSRHSDAIYKTDTRTMITSFSNVVNPSSECITNLNRTSVTAIEDASFAPQSKFAKMMMSKSGSASAKEGNCGSSAGDNEDAPMYKRLKSRDRVMARYNNDNQQYPAVVRAVMHGGYSSAQYDVLFDGFQTVHTVGWADISVILPPNSVTKLSPSTSDVSIAPVLFLHNEKQVLQVADLTRLSAERFGARSDIPPPVIRSIRYDSATGLATINEDSHPSVYLPNNGITAITTLSHQNASTVPEKDWTVKQQQVAQTHGAPVVGKGPALNPKLLQRRKGGGGRMSKRDFDCTFCSVVYINPKSTTK